MNDTLNDNVYVVRRIASKLAYAEGWNWDSCQRDMQANYIRLAHAALEAMPYEAVVRAGIMPKQAKIKTSKAK